MRDYRVRRVGKGKWVAEVRRTFGFIATTWRIIPGFQHDGVWLTEDAAYATIAHHRWKRNDPDYLDRKPVALA